MLQLKNLKECMYYLSSKVHWSHLGLRGGGLLQKAAGQYINVVGIYCECSNTCVTHVHMDPTYLSYRCNHVIHCGPVLRMERCVGFTLVSVLDLLVGGAGERRGANTFTIS